MLNFIELDLLVERSDHLMRLLVYTEKKTPRTDYIFHLMIEDIAGFSFQTTSDRKEFSTYSGPKIAYSNEAFQDAIVVPNAFFLEEKAKEVSELRFTSQQGIACPFAVEGSKNFSFDIFSAGFYLVTRCEEYSENNRDYHDRFSPFESLAYKKSFLEKPVVNIWALELREKIRSRFPSVPYQTKKNQIISTIDVDQLFAIKARGAKRTLGRLGKQLIRLEFNSIVETLAVLLFNKRDPFDTFDYILSLKKERDKRLIFFMHLGDYSVYDKSIRWNHKAMKEIAQKLFAVASVGIHPSYQSNEEPERLAIEIQRYKELLQVSPKKSRQHYLKLSFPETYEGLIRSGIEEDYTMGYAECVGFRASICTPFKFYDLQLERVHDLMVYPFAIMDRALKDGMKLNTDASIAKINELSKEVEACDGLFISLFHNESLSNNKEWRGWRRVYESVVSH